MIYCFVPLLQADAAPLHHSETSVAQPQPHSVTTGYSTLIHWHTFIGLTIAPVAFPPGKLLYCCNTAEGPLGPRQCHLNSVLYWFPVARQYMPAGTEHDVSPLGQCPSSSHRGQNRWPRSFHCLCIGHAVRPQRYCWIFRRNWPDIRVRSRRPSGSEKYLVSRSRISFGIFPVGTNRPRRFLLCNKRITTIVLVGTYYIIISLVTTIIITSSQA